MTDKSEGGRAKGDENRKTRLSEQLRANLQRRKAQSRARRAGEADQRPEGLSEGDSRDRTS